MKMSVCQIIGEQRKFCGYCFFSPVVPVLFACSAAAPRLRLPYVIPAYGCGRAHGMLAFGISCRQRIGIRRESLSFFSQKLF